MNGFVKVMVSMPVSIQQCVTESGCGLRKERFSESNLSGGGFIICIIWSRVQIGC